MNIYKKPEDKPNHFEFVTSQAPLALCRALCISLNFQKIGEAITNLPLSELANRPSPALDWPRLTPTNRVIYPLLPRFPDIVRNSIITGLPLVTIPSISLFASHSAFVLTWVTFGLGLPYCFLANSSLLPCKKNWQENLICIKCQAGFASNNLTQEKIKKKLSYVVCTCNLPTYHLSVGQIGIVTALYETDWMEVVFDTKKGPWQQYSWLENMATSWPFVLLTDFGCDGKSLINVAAEIVFKKLERQVFDIEEEWKHITD